MTDPFGPPDPLSAYVGNGAAVIVLRAALANDQISHAYLFTGPSQVGKRTLARLFAAGVVCAQHTAHSGPCGDCRSCRLVFRDAHPDVRLVAPDVGRRGVTIEQIRQLEHDASLRPYEGDHKAFILVGADAMPEPAANALLKTLEEPPEDTVLLLTASDLSQVLPTIASRCREVALRPVSPGEIAAGLIARGADPEQAALLGRLAGGRPGWAIAALADPSRLAARTEQVERLETLLEERRVARLPAAATFADAAGAKAALDVWLGWWRDALLVQQGCADLVANADRLESLRRLGAAQPTAQVWRAMARVQETRQQLDANANVRLAMEALLLDLPEQPAA